MTFSFFCNPYLTLTYDADQLTDGVGSQLQRIWKIYWIAKTLNLNYIHTPIRDVLHSPLDHWNGAIEKEKFLKEFNSRFLLPSDTINNCNITKSYKVLTRRALIQDYFQSYFFKRPTLIKTLYSFDVKLRELPYPRQLDDENTSENNFLIAIHVRYSLPINGVEQWRNLDIEYYLELLRTLSADLESQGIQYRVVILTDFPRDSLSIPISSLQEKHRWMYFLTEGQLSSSRLEIEGNDLKSLYFSKDSKISVLHGGNPIKALDLMAKANYLVISRSSFSAIGGVLNKKGVVIEPPDSQYLSSKNWSPAKNYIKIQNKWRLPHHPHLYDLLLRIYLLQFVRITVKVLRKIKHLFK